MKNFVPESGGSWCFPSITMVILLEAVVFSMAGKIKLAYIYIMALILCRIIIIGSN